MLPLHRQQPACLCKATLVRLPLHPPRPLHVRETMHCRSTSYHKMGIVAEHEHQGTACRIHCACGTTAPSHAVLAASPVGQDKWLTEGEVGPEGGSLVSASQAVLGRLAARSRSSRMASSSPRRCPSEGMPSSTWHMGHIKRVIPDPLCVPLQAWVAQDHACLGLPPSDWQGMGENAFGSTGPEWPAQYWKASPLHRERADSGGHTCLQVSVGELQQQAAIDGVVQEALAVLAQPQVLDPVSYLPRAPCMRGQKPDLLSHRLMQAFCTQLGSPLHLWAALANTCQSVQYLACACTAEARLSLDNEFHASLLRRAMLCMHCWWACERRRAGFCSRARAHVAPGPGSWLLSGACWRREQSSLQGCAALCLTPLVHHCHDACAESRSGGQHAGCWMCLLMAQRPFVLAVSWHAECLLPLALLRMHHKYAHAGHCCCHDDCQNQSPHQPCFQLGHAARLGEQALSCPSCYQSAQGLLVAPLLGLSCLAHAHLFLRWKCERGPLHLPVCPLNWSAAWQYPLPGHLLAMVVSCCWTAHAQQIPSSHALQY